MIPGLGNHSCRCGCAASFSDAVDGVGPFGALLVRADLANALGNLHGDALALFQPSEKPAHSVLRPAGGLGDLRHRRALRAAEHPGEHVAIIDRSLWDKVHSILQTSPRLRAANARARTPALLKGLIFTETGCAMTPAFTKKGTRQYRYYVSMDVIRNRPLGESPGPLRLPAPMVEDAVIGEIHRMIRAPEITARTIATLRRDGVKVEEAAVVATLAGFERLWAHCTRLSRRASSNCWSSASPSAPMASRLTCARKGSAWSCGTCFCPRERRPLHE